MKTKEIFRLEDKTSKYGVYHCEDISQIFDKHYGGTSASFRHPAPWDDSKLEDEAANKQNCDAERLKNSGNWRFGFISYSQFRSWFYSDDSLIELGKIGIVLRIYKIEENNNLIIGNSQCVFSADCHKDENVVRVVNLSKYKLKLLEKKYQ